MKEYVKPSLEVVSLNTAENIADNRVTTNYRKSAGSYGTGALEIVTLVNDLQSIS